MGMKDPSVLENELLSEIAAAKDEAAVEAIRIAALGRSGSVSALLKTLGAMTPEQRREQGPLINRLKERVGAAIAERKDELKNAALDARLNTETLDVTLPVREPPAEVGRVHPLSQVNDELIAIFADMGFSVAEGPDIESEDYNFTKLNFPEGHVLSKSEARRIPPFVAHAYVARADQNHVGQAASHSGHHPGPHLSQRQRPDAHPDVSSARGSGHR
jgi:phenylalanyl-tRNA synthetase alpha subunit